MTPCVPWRCASCSVSSTDAPDALTKMYGTLSTAVYDSRSPEEYQQ